MFYTPFDSSWSPDQEYVWVLYVWNLNELLGDKVFKNILLFSANKAKCFYSIWLIGINWYYSINKINKVAKNPSRIPSIIN